jgi:Asparagine synthase
MIDDDFAHQFKKSDSYQHLDPAITYPSRWFPRSLSSVRKNDLLSIDLLPYGLRMRGLGLGVELACPLLERDLVEHVFSLPTWCRFDELPRAYARRAMRQLLPQHIRDRRTKSPFFSGYELWLWENRPAICEIVTDSLVPSCISVKKVRAAVDHLDMCEPRCATSILHRLHRAALQCLFVRWFQSAKRSHCVGGRHI